MKIASRYRPFSHAPGCTTCILGTRYVATVYPTAVWIKDEQGGQIQIEWQLTGLVKNFTVMQDLEKNRLLIHGTAQEGYFNYMLFAQDSSLILRLDRANMGILKGILKPLHTEILLKPKEQLVLFALTEPVVERSLEKLSFGNHKAQEWERITRRNDPLEYLPFWFAAGQLSLGEDPGRAEGTENYLEVCKKLLDQGNKDRFLTQLTELFQVGFSEFLLPRLYDTHHLGITAVQSKDISTKAPLALLKEGYHLIRAMFLQTQGEKVSVLPHLPAAFYAGRCLGFKLSQASCAIEWSKKLLKRLIITSFAEQTIHFRFQTPLKSFRLRAARGIKGKEISCGDPVELGQGLYILDQFKK